MKQSMRTTPHAGAFATVCVLLVGTIVSTQSPSLPLARVVPDEIKWPGAKGCVRQVVIAGDPNGTGLYATRMRFSAGCKVAPHAHPHERIVTVLSGTMLVGYGERFDETRLQPLPPGSTWTEPAGQPHFAWAKDDEVELQVVGRGPYSVMAVPQR